MKQAIIKLLRGRYNSIRYRFLVLPRLWFVYGWYRITGRDWISYYTTYMDRPAKKHLEENQRPSDRYLDQANEHLDYLRSHGLKEGMSLLDYGCGVLRLGLIAIPFIGKNKYVGVDISQARLDQGSALLSEAGISRDDYKTFRVSDCALTELRGETFDFIWANSVLTHMELPDIRKMFAGMRTVMNENTVYYFNFSESDNPIRMNLKDFWYPRSVIREAAEAEGFQFQIEDDWRPNSPSDTMARVTLGK